MKKESEARRPSQAGVTLIEVLVAVALLGIVASAVMGSVGTSLHLSHLAVERSVATGLAAERLHKLGSLPFQSDLNHEEYGLSEETIAGTSPVYTYSTPYGSIPDHPDYTRLLTLSYETPDAGLMKAEVTVTWRNISQGEKSHTLITYVHPDLERQQ